MSSSPGPGGELTCPRCGRPGSSDERFCERCGMPLVLEGAASLEAPRSDAHERARKVRPEYTRGGLIRVAGGRNQAEAELIQNMLMEEGVPSVLRRSAGFDVPDFLAAGPRDVLVPESGAAVARGTLLEAELVTSADQIGRPPTRRQAVLVVAGLLAGGGLAALIAWLALDGAV